jgi:two-component system response regulator FixJ
MTQAPVIYLVDDDHAVRTSLCLLLEVEGFTVSSYGSAQAFLDDAPDAQAGCLITDLHMAGMTGLELVVGLRRQGFTFPVLLITGRTHAALAAEAIEAGATQLIPKPFSPDEIVDAVRMVVGGSLAPA